MQAEITREWVTYKQAEELSGLSRTTLWKLLGCRRDQRRPAWGVPFASIATPWTSTWSRLRKVHREVGLWSVKDHRKRRIAGTGSKETRS